MHPALASSTSHAVLLNGRLISIKRRHAHRHTVQKWPRTCMNSDSLKAIVSTNVSFACGVAERVSFLERQTVTHQRGYMRRKWSTVSEVFEGVLQGFASHRSSRRVVWHCSCEMYQLVPLWSSFSMHMVEMSMQRAGYIVSTLAHFHHDRMA